MTGETKPDKSALFFCQLYPLHQERQELVLLLFRRLLPELHEPPPYVLDVRHVRPVEAVFHHRRLKLELLRLERALLLLEFRKPFEQALNAAAPGLNC